MEVVGDTLPFTDIGQISVMHGSNFVRAALGACHLEGSHS